MAKKFAMKKKPANIVSLSNRKPRDVQAVDNIKQLAEILPGCSDLTSAARWLCENEIPKVIKRLKKAFAP